jgi:4-nitrophenyl phosphatase
MQDTLAWRRSYRPELITPDEIAEEAKTGKQIISGFDQEGRPILYLRPGRCVDRGSRYLVACADDVRGRENTQPSPQQVRFLVFALERALGA